MGSIDFINPQHIICDSGCGSPPATADATTFVFTSTNVSPVSFVVDDAAPHALADGKYGIARMSGNRILYVDYSKSAAGHVICDSGCSAAASVLSADTTANPTIPQNSAFDMFYNGTTWDRFRGDVTNGLWVNCKTGCAAASNVLMADTAGNPTIPQYATFGMFYNGTTWDRVRGDTTSGMWVNLKAAIPTGANAIGSITNTGFNVNNFPATYDTSDRAARLLGVVYGSQAQQLKQTATNFNLQVELFAAGTAYDARSIRALTSADVVTSNQGAANTVGNAWPILVTDGTNTATVKAGLTAAAAADKSLVTAFSPNSPVPAGTNIVGKVTTDQTTHGTTDLVAADLTKRNGIALDPCEANAKSYGTINQTATTQILGLAGSSKKYYICNIHVVTATAQNVAVIGSTTAGNACATSPTGVDGFGGSTAATGWNFAANGGIAMGNGASSLGASHDTNAALCIAQSAAGQLSGGFSYVIQ